MVNPEELISASRDRARLLLDIWWPEGIEGEIYRIYELLQAMLFIPNINVLLKDSGFKQEMLALQHLAGSIDKSWLDE